MFKPELYSYKKEQLINWIRFEAGSSNPDYFLCKTAGGLKLQQIPEEFAELLLFLKDKRIETYLELGIGNGGSFSVMCYFLQRKLEKAVAVDDFSYRNQIQQSVIEVNAMIQQLDIDADIMFINSTTDAYFNHLVGKVPHETFDTIFIDADHSYQGARKDYDNALKHINKGGLIIFHDINSNACPGIKQLWSEVKKDHKQCIEFIASTTCGIGVAIVN